MPRRPNPIFFVVIGVAFTLIALGLNMGGDSKDGAEPTPTLAQETMPATVVPPTPILPAATAMSVPPTPTPLPDRTSCAEIMGTAYRSAAEREWYIQNCTSSYLAPQRNDEAA